jgi:hypothetical protein
MAVRLWVALKTRGREGDHAGALGLQQHRFPPAPIPWRAAVLVPQGRGMTAPFAGPSRPGEPRAAHQLATGSGGGFISPPEARDDLSGFRTRLRASV